MHRIVVAIWFVIVTVFVLAVIADDADPVSSGSPPVKLVAAAPPGIVEITEMVPTTTTTIEELDVPISQVPVRPSAAQGSTAPVSSGCDSEAWVIPAGIVWRESHCDYGAVNVNGCGGYGCLGAYQFDARHFDGWANGTAACGDLDWTIPADQHECAARLSGGGTNLAPWGG